MAHYVLVPGGFIGGWYWDGVAGPLKKAGHRVDVVEQLPSAGSDPGELADLAGDAMAVKRYVEAADEPAVLVGHSYGGMVITELADHPNVAHSVYMTGVWPSRGQSMFAVFAGGPPPTWFAAHDDGTLRVTDDLELLRDTLCADVEKEEAEAGLRRLMPQSLASATSTSSAPARAHPTTYVVCEDDQCLPLPVQEQMAAQADSIERLASSHQPMLSMPEELATVLGRVH